MSDVYVVKHPQWEHFVEDKTQSSYEAVDNELDKIGLDQICDVNAGGFYSDNDNVIYFDEHWMGLWAHGDIRARRLAKHEKGHKDDVPLNNHPTDFKGGLEHAKRVGFDDRSYTWLLRFHWYMATMPEFLEWESIVLEDWKLGRLVARDAP